MSNDLTISQALRKIKKLKGQVGEQRSRAEQSNVHRADSPPAFDFSQHLERSLVLREELVSIEAAVAVANATTKLDWAGKPITIAQAIRMLAELKGEIAWLQSLNCRAHPETLDYENEYQTIDGHNRIVKVPHKVTCHLPEASRAEMIAAAQDKFDRLNDLVETTNHKTQIPRWEGRREGDG